MANRPLIVLGRAKSLELAQTSQGNFPKQLWRNKLAPFSPPLNGWLRSGGSSQESPGHLPPTNCPGPGGRPGCQPPGAWECVPVEAEGSCSPTHHRVEVLTPAPRPRPRGGGCVGTQGREMAAAKALGVDNKSLLDF